MNAKILFYGLCFFLCGSCVINHAYATTLPIQTITSQKGITAWLVEDHSIPVITLSFAFQGAGSVADPPTKQGLAALAAATIDEGAGTLDAQAFQAELRNNAIILRFTSDRDVFGGTLKTLSKNKTKAFDLLALALAHPRFDMPSVDRMRAATLARLKSNAVDPQWRAARLMYDRAYTGNPYANNSGGTISSLSAITRQDLQTFAKNKLTTLSLKISVAGDITPVALKKVLDHVFGVLPEGKPEDVFIRATLHNTGKVFLHPYDTPQSVIQMIKVGLAPTDKNYATLEVVNYILGGGGFGSRLMDVLREKKGLTYGISSHLMHLEGSDSLILTTAVDNNNVGEVLKLIRIALTSMQKTPPTMQELIMAKAGLKGDMLLSFTSTDSIAEILLGIYRSGLSPNYLDRRALALDQITLQDVQELARRILNPQDFMTVIVGRPTKSSQKFISVETVNGIE